MIVRTQSLAGEYVHVDERDPALARPPDLDPTDPPAARAEAQKRLDEFQHAYDKALELGVLSSLPLRNGEVPVVWRLRHLSADEVAWVVDRGASGTGNLTLSLDILALSLVGVGNVKGEDGKPFEVKREPDARRGGFVSLRREHLDLLLREDNGRLSSGRLTRLANRVWADINPPKG